jgi:hypothetical protein
MSTPREAGIDAAIAEVGSPTCSPIRVRVRLYQGARAVEEGKLVIVLREFESDPMPVTVIHAGQGLLLLKMRSFLEFAVPRLRRSLPTNPNDG